MFKKENTLQNVVIVLLVVAIVAMSIGFATFDTDLNITGSATFAQAKWDIAFDTTSFAFGTDNTVTTNPVSFSGTNMQYTVTLNPGDVYEFTIDVANNGTFDANLVAVTLDKAPSEITETYIDYDFEVNGTAYTSSASSLAIALSKKVDTTVSKHTVHVRIEYLIPADPSVLPSDAAVTKTFNATLTYALKES